MAKGLVSIRLSDNGRLILDRLTAELGVTQAGVVELALRALAKKEAIPLPLALAQDFVAKHDVAASESPQP